MHPQTRLTLAGQQTDTAYRSISLPIYQSAIFKFGEDGEKPQFDYSRSGNPTRAALEQTLADLEGGAGAVCVGSGMAAIATVLSLYPAGSHFVCSHDCYGGTERLLSWWERQGKISVTYADLSDPLQLALSLRPETKAVWVETPSNPLLRITDLRRVGSIAKDAGIDFIVDSTFLTPLLQRPIDFGADFVVHSTTKYLNGHSDVVGGAVIARTQEGRDAAFYAANAQGATAVPFDSWLILRGLKTLPLRLKQHEENATAVAHYLQQHDAIETVFYPGLEDHEGHDVAAKQQAGFGGMLSFAVRDGVCLRTLLSSTRVFALAESLGGVESLIEQPATMSHASMRPEAREAAGITDRVVRLSVGIEHIEDLLTDLEQALENGVAAGRRDAQRTHRNGSVVKAEAAHRG
ncbi:MAG: PLP-dependent aspartate aminotransferase family protein [Bacteroidetes bacterium]|nr:PLP-dependent aspartate aminotransferase family protein [Bacteroidota bacterium]MDA0874202.1 PLP-dependent aspartate aminotransferase family protein [Bacteroidota bacterium]